MNFWNYLVILRPTRIGMLVDGPTNHEKSVVGAHFAYCSTLVAEGTMLLAGRSLGSPEQVIGIAILHADSLEHAEEIAAADPAVANNVMIAEVQPYGLALLSQNPHNV